MFTISPPGAMSLTGDLASGWLRWIELFQLYMLATEKTTKPGPVQVAMLLTLMGPEAIDIFRTFEWENVVDKDDIDLVESFRWPAFCDNAAASRGGFLIVTSLASVISAPTRVMTT